MLCCRSRIRYSGAEPDAISPCRIHTPQYADTARAEREKTAELSLPPFIPQYGSLFLVAVLRVDYTRNFGELFFQPRYRAFEVGVLAVLAALHDAERILDVLYLRE